jgi:hypothetical protein
MSFLKSNKVLYHLDRLQQWADTGDTTAPINVKIDLTNVCNHNWQSEYESILRERSIWAEKCLYYYENC